MPSLARRTRALYASRCESSDDIMAYADEPLADEEWIKKYEAGNEENKRLEPELQARLAEVSLNLSLTAGYSAL